MNGAVVVDASVAVKWLVREVYSDRAESLTRTWLRQGTRIVVPYLMLVEVSNALYQKARQGEIALDAAAGLVENLVSKDITLWETSGPHSRALELAAALNQPAVYDAHYLALAEIIGCDLWTADERFFRSEAGQFPNLHWIGEFST